jgi:predicted RNA polymerase sigma factor
MVRLYDALLALQPSAVVALHAIGPAQALPLVESLAGYPWWASARADLLQRLNRRDEARGALRQAIAWTGNERDRNLLLERLERM